MLTMIEENTRNGHGIEFLCCIASQFFTNRDTMLQIDRIISGTSSVGYENAVKK